MRVYYINVQQPLKDTDKARSSVGGKPILVEGQRRPHCKLCKTEMFFFFQFDLPRGFDLPFKEDSHLLVFMCPVHNDVPLDVSEFADRKLPARYWQRDFGHYELILNRPSRHEQTAEMETHIEARRLKFTEADEDISWDGRVERGSEGFKVGGVPGWNEPHEPRMCSCGAEMIFLCQIPRNFSFSPIKETAEPHSAQHGYSIFAGKPTYIFACKEQCTPRSLYAVSLETADSELESQLSRSV